MRITVAFLLALAAAGCASQSANEPPEPNVVEIVSVPNHASVSLDCGSGTVVKGTTPLRVDVPKYPEVCTMEVGADDYRPLRMKFNRGLVLKQGIQLREDEHHQLDQSASTFDMLTRPAVRFLRDYVLLSGWRDGRNGFIAATTSAFCSLIRSEPCLTWTFSVS